MQRTILMTIALTAATLALTLGVGSSTSQNAANASQQVNDHAKLRVGVYDNRPIAIAYVRSPYFSMEAKMKEYEQAKAAGDEQRVKALDSWGEKLQRQLHRQGFGRVPVTDMLSHVGDQFPDLAKQLGVDVIAFECNYHGEDVEVVDVTRDLVKLFVDSDAAVKQAMEILQRDPIDLDDIEQDRDH